MEGFEYNLENIRKMQLVELDMLRELDRICRKCGINYVIDSGTLLGAVRHKGFIPWDDDIDVKMIRKDYEKFCRVCKKVLNKKFFLQTHKTDKEYRWEYARILKNGTTFIRKGHDCLKSRNGIFIDIFPVDNLPDDVFSRLLCNFVSLLSRKVLYSEVGKVSSSSRIKQIGFTLLNVIPKRTAHRWMEFVANYSNAKKSKKVRCYSWGSKAETLGSKREWMEQTCDIKFENLVVKAPADYLEVLELYYGKDYMTPPPRNMRIPKHTATYIKFSDDVEASMSNH